MITSNRMNYFIYTTHNHKLLWRAQEIQVIALGDVSNVYRVNKKF